jgi:hypothetical protein
MPQKSQSQSRTFGNRSARAEETNADLINRGAGPIRFITHYPIWFVGLTFAAGALWKKGFSLVFATAGSSLRIEYKKHPQPLPESSALESGDPMTPMGRPVAELVSRWHLRRSETLHLPTEVVIRCPSVRCGNCARRG